MDNVTQKKLLKNSESVVGAIVRLWSEEYARRRDGDEPHDSIAEDIATDIDHGCDEESVVGEVYIKHTDAIWDAVCEELKSEYQGHEKKRIESQAF